ncbi:MAG: hypothetical protein WCQ95_01525 [Bacteroidota bacterium]
MERLVKNWKTSLIGVIILAGALFSLLTGKIDATGFMLILPTVLIMLRVKDTFLGKKPKTDQQG